MPLYPAWLDYLAWGLWIAGILCGLSILSQPAGPRRGWLKLAAFVSFGAGTVIGGVTGILANVRSPRPTITGTITSVIHHHASRSSSTRLYVQTDGGQSIGLTTNRDLSELEENATIKVTYQPFADRPLDMEVLSGRYDGWHHTESDGLFGSSFVVLAGFVTILVGGFAWNMNPTAEVEDSDTRDDSNLDGDVDTASLLNLSNRDES